MVQWKNVSPCEFAPLGLFFIHTDKFACKRGPTVTLIGGHLFFDVNPRFVF